MEQIDAALAKTEEINGKKFGDDKNPLLVSVRSGARASMPGMMDTILNLGLNDDSRQRLWRKPDPASSSALPMTPTAASSRCSPTWLWSSTRSAFEVILDEVKEAKGVQVWTPTWTAEDLKEVGEALQGLLSGRKRAWTSRRIPRSS